MPRRFMVEKDGRKFIVEAPEEGGQESSATIPSPMNTPPPGSPGLSSAGRPPMQPEYQGGPLGVLAGMQGALNLPSPQALLQSKSHVGEGINPENDPVMEALGVKLGRLGKAGEEFGKENLSGSLANVAAAWLPGGEGIAQAGERIRGGDVAGGLGQGLGTVLPFMAAPNVSELPSVGKLPRPDLGSLAKTGVGLALHPQTTIISKLLNMIGLGEKEKPTPPKINPNILRQLSRGAPYEDPQISAPSYRSEPRTPTSLPEEKPFETNKINPKILQQMNRGAANVDPQWLAEAFKQLKKKLPDAPEPKVLEKFKVNPRIAKLLKKSSE